MIDKDYLIKAMDQEGQVKVTLARTTNLVEEAHVRHNTSATASAALGRVLTAALMMGSDLKGENDVLTLRVVGNGSAGTLVAAVDSQGNGRAFMSNPQADLPSIRPGKLNVGGIVGQDGYLELTKNMGLKQPFVGRVELTSGEIAEDLARYFLMSEQIPALVALGVLVERDLSVKTAGGLIIQAMPGADDSLLEILESNILNMGPISSLLVDNPDLNPILEKLFASIEYRLLNKQLLKFKCTCNRERLKTILASFTKDELIEIYEEEGVLEARCNFCNENYQFSLDEILALKDKKP
ncbi:MAG TPA: Hsp33 family molecular chaperone HslO [Syntrophomonadaceae bacterium]|nr:Hsp33 family molecular chaperone HslO [Syntrophomonadaceae bacterium]